MAIFGSKKNTEVEKKPVKAKKADKPTKATKAVAVAPAVAAPSTTVDVSGIIQRPRITEKASSLAESNAYAFEVSSNATKATVAKAITQLYGVTPVKVAILNIPVKQLIVRNIKGTKRGGRKAYVYLKKGETIELA